MSERIMNAEQIEKLLQQALGKVSSFVMSFVQKREEQVSSRLDALLVEKAKEEGINIALKKPFNWLKFLGLTAGSAAFLAGAYFIIFFVPGPWVRFIAKPQVVTMQLENVEFSFNGVSADKKSLSIISPKAIKGAQFVSANLEITPKTAVNISLEENNTKIVVTANETLAEGVAYTVSLKSGVLFTDGTYLANEQAWVIPTKASFDVVSISPRDGSFASSNVAFEVLFTTDEFELDVAKQNISLFPAIEGTYQKIGTRIVFTPKNALQSNGVYTLVVNAGMKDRNNNQIKQEYRSTFTITKEQESKVTAPSFSLSASPIINVAGGSYGTMISATNIDQVKVEYFKASWADLQPYVNEYMQKRVLNPEPVIAGKQAESTISLKGNASNEYSVYTIPYEKLADGVYVVRISSETDSKLRTYLLAFKSPLGVYASTRELTANVDVWAFDYATQNPAKDVTITGASCTKNSCSTVSEVSPENGNVLLKADRKISYIYAEKNGQVAILYAGQRYNTFLMSDEARIDRSIFAQVIQNKPKYLPGDTYKYVVLLRKHNQGKYEKLPKNMKFIVALCPMSGTATDIYIADEKTLMGACTSLKEVQSNGDSQLIDVLELWQRNEAQRLVVAQKTENGLNVVVDQYINIAESDRPQASVSVSLNKSRFVGKESVTVTGRLTNIAGAGIANKSGEIEISFRAVGDSRNDLVTDIVRNVSTDNSGNFKTTIPLPADKAKQYAYDMYVTAEFRDGENLISDLEAASWDHGEVLTSEVTGNNRGDYASIGSSPIIQLNLHNPSNNEPAKNRKVTLTVTRRYQVEIVGDYYYDDITKTTKQYINYENREEQVFKKENAVFSDKGEYSFELKDVKEGSYYLQVFDSSGDWVVRNDTQILWTTSANQFDTVNRVNEWVYEANFDKESATIGEKVTLTIESSYTKTKQQIAMIFKTGEVIDWRYISQDTRKIEIPITEKMLGGLQVCFIHPMKAYSSEDGETKTFLGNVMNVDSCAYLLVENKEKELKIEMIPEKTTVEPGKESKLEVKVQNSDNKTEPALLGITVVDKAVYLAEDDTVENQKLQLYRDIYQQFSAYSGMSYATLYAHDLLDQFGGMGGAGGEANAVRKEFDENTYWNAQIYTDVDGKATINIPYNDSITTWVVTVWAVTDDFKVGSRTIEISASKNVYVDLDKPEVLRVGDSWKPYIRVVNTSNEPFSGTLEATCDGCLNDKVSLSVSLAARSTADVVIDAKVAKEGKLPFTVKLTQNGNFVDGLTYNIVARPLGVLEPMSLQKSISKKDTEITLNIPEDANVAFGSYTLSIGKLPILSDLSTTLQSANATTDDISARLLSLATIALHDAYGTTNLTEEQVLRDAQYYVAELQYRMLSNGGFPVLLSGGEDYQASSNAAIAIGIAMKAFGERLVVNEYVLNLVGTYQQKLILADTVTLEAKAKAAYAMASVIPSESSTLVTALLKANDIKTASVENLSYLALALTEIGATSDAGAVTTQLATMVKESAGLLYVPSKESILSTTALSALYRKLNFSAVKVEDLAKMQQWVLANCVTCAGKSNAAIATYLLASSYADSQLGSAREEEYALLVNGKELTKLYYNGQSASFDLPVSELKKGGNSVKLVSSSGKAVFVTISGNHYKTAVSAVVDPSQRIEVAYLGSSNRNFKLGGKGYLQVTITAQEDLASQSVAIYLPSGLTDGIYYFSADYSKLLSQGALIAYKSNYGPKVYQTTIASMKKGEKKIVLLPVIAVRQGSFGGEVVRVLSTTGKGSTVVGANVSVN